MSLRLPLLALALPALLSAQRPIVVRPYVGMVITRSLRLAPGVYRLPARNDTTPTLTVRGDGITVDMRGVVLTGTPETADPDERRGLAVLIDGGSAVTITGGRIRGYQTGIRAVGTTDLAITGTDLSDNWRPRLFSRQGHESLVDWLSFHHNEQGEWRRFGAGIALEGVHRGHLEGITVRRGMNGVMLTRSDSIRIEENDLSFNSGVGIGLYRSTDNVLIRNHADYNVRGFSRYYRRGQDSADLLMFEQSSANHVADNSMTHGGDGLFLWAGQSTMDSGEGGSNDNFFLSNDFSYAPTNAMEATFSRNVFVANRAVGSDHGLWGGFSFGSTVAGNCFAGNRIGIAIEHGQGDTIQENRFVGDSTAIFLWADSIAPSDWGYPRHRDTRSRDWHLARNVFEGNQVGLRIRQSIGLTERADRYLAVDTLAVMRDTAQVVLDQQVAQGTTDPRPCAAMPEIPPEWHWQVSAGVPTSVTSLLDRSAIIVDEWGPYDWATPKLWPIDSTPNAPLQVLGPSGRWRVVDSRGLTALSRTGGRSGDTIVVTPAPASLGDWDLVLRDSAGRRFTFAQFDPITGWDVQYFHASGAGVNWSETPFLERHEPRLDKMWYRPPSTAIPGEHWALLARTEVTLAPGEYTLRAISDDAVRVWVDGRAVIDDWATHESAVDAVPLDGGHHGIWVQYRQDDGWMELRVEIVKGKIASTGSPGPH